MNPYEDDHVCPECAQKKCANCDGTSWDNQIDGPVPCACSEAGHA